MVGGYSLGFYHVWCPNKCIWFQEDLSSLFSPQLYDDFLMEQHVRLCHDYEYTVIHLHPSSFFILDRLLEIDRLKAIQVNKDIGGPDIKTMIPYLQKVLAKKNLILFGDLSQDDIDCIFDYLPQGQIYLNIVVDSADQAKKLFDYILHRA